MIVEHAFEQLAAEGAVQPDWEANQRCIRLACYILLQQRGRMSRHTVNSKHFHGRGCIFETLPGRPSSLLATDHTAYANQRSQWPCSPAACSLLLGPKVAQLVTALFGSTAGGTHQCPKLFNDQVFLLRLLAGCVFKHEVRPA